MPTKSAPSRWEAMVISPTKAIAVFGWIAITFSTLSEYRSGLLGYLMVARQSAASRTPSNSEQPATILIYSCASLFIHVANIHFYLYSTIAGILSYDTGNVKQVMTYTRR